MTDLVLFTGDFSSTKHTFKACTKKGEKALLGLGGGATDPSPFIDTSIKWTEVTVMEQAGSIDLYIKLNSADNDIIFVPSGNLPITFSGYDITDMWIKTSAANAQINIIAWR